MTPSESRFSAETGSTSSPKPFSISLGSRRKQAHKVSLNAKKRPRSGLADDSDSDGEARNEHQPVSSFDHAAGGAIGTKSKKEAQAPLMIQSQKNKDWRAEAAKKKGKNLLPAEEQARRKGRHLEQNVVEVTTEEQPRTYGLIVTKRATDLEDGKEQTTESSKSTTFGELEVAQKAPMEKTADEEALEALTGDRKKESTLVIQGTSAPDDRFAPRVSETNAFKSDVASRPDMASIGSYETVPIEEFGKALIRGMGWKEGEEIGKRKGVSIKAKEIKRRPGLLGIGAKQAPEGLEELGAWGKSAKKGVKMDTSFTPLLLKNKKTGEMLTEEEHKKRQENPKIIEDGSRGKRDSQSKSSGSGKERTRERDSDRKERRKEDGRKTYREDSSRRDRSRSPNHRKDRERDRTRDINRDEDRNKERNRDTRRRRDYDGDDDKRREKERKYRSRDTDKDDSRYRRDDRKEYHQSKPRRRD